MSIQTKFVMMILKKMVASFLARLKKSWVYIPTIVIFELVTYNYYSQDGRPLFGSMLFVLFGFMIYFALSFKQLFSPNILVMTFFTYLLFPLSLSLTVTLIIALFINITFLITLAGIVIISVVMYFYCLLRNNWDTNYLENTKISFDIIRLVFAIILTLVALSSPYLNGFYDFNELFQFAHGKTIEETRKIFNITFQVMGFPFVASTTLLKIISDYILLNNKRRNKKSKAFDVNITDINQINDKQYELSVQRKWNNGESDSTTYSVIKDNNTWKLNDR